MKLIYEQYVWRFYPNLKENPKFEGVSNKLEPSQTSKMESFTEYR